MERHEVEVLREGSRIASALAPIRKRLLEELDQPHSATQLAPVLGLTRQKVNYHLRELERCGLIQLVERRKRRGFVETLYQRVSRAIVIDPSLLGSTAPIDMPAARSVANARRNLQQIEERVSSSYLLGLAARLIREVATLRQRATRANKRLLTMSLESQIAFRSPSAFSDFRAELAAELARLSKKYHSERGGSLSLRLVVGVHPVLVSEDASLQSSETQD